MRRGEDEGILRISVDADTERITEALCRRFIRPGSATRTYMEAAVADSLKRLIRPSIETTSKTITSRTVSMCLG